MVDPTNDEVLSETLENVKEANDALNAETAEGGAETGQGVECSVLGVEGEAEGELEDIYGEMAVGEAPVRTTDDIADGEWEVFVVMDKGEMPLPKHKIKWVQWGADSILVRPVSYAGPDFICADLAEAARLVPVFE